MFKGISADLKQEIIPNKTSSVVTSEKSPISALTGQLLSRDQWGVSAYLHRNDVDEQLQEIMGKDISADDANRAQGLITNLDHRSNSEKDEICASLPCLWAEGTPGTPGYDGLAGAFVDLAAQKTSAGYSPFYRQDDSNLGKIVPGLQANKDRGFQHLVEYCTKQNHKGSSRTCRLTCDTSGIACQYSGCLKKPPVSPKPPEPAANPASAATH